MPAEISWSARTSLAIDPDVEKGSSLARLLFLSRQTASLGNADQAARILDIAQESALLKADLAMRQCADLLSLSHQLQVQEKRGEAMAKLTGTVRDDLELETWHQQDIGTRSMSAIACIELAALVGSDDTEQHDSMDPTEAQLGEYSDLHQLCSPLQRTQLFLLQAATKQAPHLALGWAALSNWLHARLAEGELEVNRLSVLYHVLCEKAGTPFPFQPCIANALHLRRRVPPCGFGLCLACRRTPRPVISWSWQFVLLASA